MAADASPSFALEGPLARRGGRQPYESLVLTTSSGAVQRIRRGTAVLVNARRGAQQRTLAAGGAALLCGLLGR